jgi:hypothetical protein
VFDPALLAIVGSLAVIGLVTLYSAGNDFPWRITDQARNFAIAFGVLFIAFAPADNPKIAMAVLVENGGFGARAAAPIVRQVLDYYLLGKVPTEPAKEGPDEEAPAAAAARAARAAP